MIIRMVDTLFKVKLQHFTEIIFCSMRMTWRGSALEAVSPRYPLTSTRRYCYQLLQLLGVDPTILCIR